MKILFQSRSDIFSIRGGDTLQMEETKKAIEKLDKSIKIDISTDLMPNNINKYDVIHLFNIDWIPETYIQAKWASSHNKPIVLSAIHHSESEVELFENKFRFGIRRLYNALIPWQSVRDVWKNIYRSIFNYKKIYPTVIQALRGIRNQQREILSVVDMVLVQTDLEAEDIKTDFKVKNFKWKKVVNGVNIDLFSKAKKDNKKRVKNTILSVGRIEPRKNQINIIKAFNLLSSTGLFDGLKLEFIGAVGKNHREYEHVFRRLISENKDISYLGQVSQSVVANKMASSDVYVHASWFETTGLACIEAAYSGMTVVATGERVKEYLEDNAYYCSPDDVSSIRQAMEMALNNKKDLKSLQNMVEKKYSWEEAGKQTISVYNDLLLPKNKMGKKSLRRVRMSK